MTTGSMDHVKFKEINLIKAIITDWQEENGVDLNENQKSSLVDVFHSVYVNTLSSARKSMAELTNHFVEERGVMKNETETK